MCQEDTRFNILPERCDVSTPGPRDALSGELTGSQQSLKGTMSFCLPSKQRERFGGGYRERPAAQDSALPAGLSPALTVCLWGSDLAILSFSFLVCCRAGTTKSLRGQCMNEMKLIVTVINETAHRSCLGAARRQKRDSGLKDQEVQQKGLRGRRDAAGSRGGAAGRQQAWWWRRRGLSTVGLGTGPGGRGPEAPA